jgi:anti-anti-sigma factor
VPESHDPNTQAASTSQWRADSLSHAPLTPGLSLHERACPDGQLSLTLRGELDIATGELVRARLAELRLAGTPTLLVLSELSFIDLGGLRVISDALEAADRAGWALEVSPHYSHGVRKLLTAVRKAAFTGRLGGADRLLQPPWWPGT